MEETEIKILHTKQLFFRGEEELNQKHIAGGFRTPLNEKGRQAQLH